jgi:DNA-binding SARP family transcriptional activator
VEGIELRLLGIFMARRDGVALPERVVGSRKARTLLKLLVLDDGVVPLDRIADALWGDEPPPKADRNVASLVSRLRTWLGTDAIDGGPTGYRFVEGAVKVDVRRAERLVEEAEERVAAAEPALAAAAAQAALDLFSAGPLLADEPDAAWADEARRRAERLHGRARRARWLAALDLGDHAAALDAARAAVAADPLDEEACRAVMLAHYRAGEPGHALAAYAELRKVLVEELGANPGPETEALHLAVLQEDLPVEAPAPPVAEVVRAADPLFVGRDAELADLRRRWSDAAAGQPTLTLVVGEAGIGKTRLVAELAAVAQATGGLVVQARCYEAERSLFVQPWTEAVRAVAVRLPPDRLRQAVADGAGALGELVPEVASALRPLRYERAPAELERRRAFDAFTGLFRRLSRSAPVLLAFDDLHHAGASTTELLHVFVRSLGIDRVHVVATVRPDEGDDVLHQLAPLGTVVELGPLGEDAVAALARVMGAPDLGPRVARITRGHPLYAVEALRAVTDIEGTDSDDVPVPPSLRDAVLARVRRAGPEVEELLRGAVILGRAFDPEVVARLLDIGVEDAARRAERALAARLLVEAGATYEFANDLIGDVLYDTTPAPTRVARHRRAAGLAADNPEAVARHAAAAGEWAVAVQSWRQAAARAVAAFANADAERLLGAALDVADRVEDPRVEVEVRLARGMCREHLADYRGAHDDHAVALELARALGDAALEAQALERLGWTAWWARDARSADELAAQAGELAERAAAVPLARPGALVLAGRMRHWRGDLVDGEAVLREAVAGEADPATAVHAAYALGAVLAHTDRYAEGRAVLDDTVAQAERTGAFRVLLSALFFGALVRANVGDFGAALSLLERKRALLEEFDVPVYRPRTATTTAWIWWELGERGRARELVAEALDAAELAEARLGAGQLHEHAHALLAAAELALLDGDDAGATDRLVAVGSLCGRDLPFEWRWELRLLDLRSRLEPARAEEAYEQARARGCRKYEALALMRLGRRDEAAAIARVLGSDLLLAEVAPPDEAGAAVDRVAAGLPAPLREGFVARGRVPAAVATAAPRPGARRGGR